VQALALDKSYLKAWQRRAGVRRGKGHLLGCLQDLDAALKLAPGSAVLGHDIRSVMRLFAKQNGLELPSALEAVHVSAASPDAADTADAVATPDNCCVKDEVRAPAGQQRGALIQPVGPVPGLTGAPDAKGRTGSWVDGTCASGEGDEGHVLSAAAIQEVSAVSQAAVCELTNGAVDEAQHAKASAAGAARPSEVLPGLRVSDAVLKGQAQAMGAPLAVPKRGLTPPASASQFEATWRGLQHQGDISSLARYLLLVPPGDVVRMLKSLLSPKLLHSVVYAALAGVRQGEPGRSQHVTLLEALPGLDRFAMTVMLLVQQQKQELASAWTAATVACSSTDLTARMEQLRSQFHL
jgi:Potential Monad-binding region of RPAP3